MNKNQALTALLAENSKICEALHKMARIDWQQPVSVTEYSGKFTYNSICKEIKNLTEADRKNCNIFLLYKNPEEWFTWKRERVFVVEVGTSEFKVLKEDIRGYKGISYTYNLEAEHRKSDFEEARKSGKLHYWLVIQERSKENHREPVYDRSARFVVKDFTSYIIQERKGEFISRFEVKPMDRNYSTITLAPNGRSHCLSVHVPVSERYTILDKSGYIVSDQRERYMNKAKSINAEKSKAAAAAWNGTETIAAFKARIDKMLEYLKTELSQSAIDYRKIIEVSNYLKDATGEIKRLEKNDFQSVNSINSCINWTENYISKAEERFK